MNRFADSPYFLINDFFEALIAPADPQYLQPDITNHHKKVLFTDVIVIGGLIHDGAKLHTNTSTPFVDNLIRYPEFDESVDQAQIFTSNDVSWNGWYDRSATISYYLDSVDINGDLASVGVMMRNGDNTGELVVKGGSYVDLYAKLDDYGFVPVKIKPVELPPEGKKFFKFISVDDYSLEYNGENVVYDSDVLADEPYYDGSRVSIQTYDYTYNKEVLKWGDLTLDDIVANGTELYFRKDSSFHWWLHDFAVNYYKEKFDVNYYIRNFVNTDKLFVYFGDTYKTSKKFINDPDVYHVVFNGLKDWVKQAIPVNNQTENFVEFTDTYFDQVYSEGYQLLKNVWTLRDGWECDRRFLGYIPTFYGLDRYDDVPEWQAPSFREYSAELVWLMKRKGTYASAQIVFEMFCNNSKNIFLIIERWHVDSGIRSDDWKYVLDDDGHIVHCDRYSIFDDCEDFIYTGLYDKPTPVGTLAAGEYWYSQFRTPAEYPEGYLKRTTLNGTENMILAPFYRLDLDLSTEPLTTFQIMPEQISRKLYYNWEILRPINRTADYNLVYAPFTDLTGTEYSLYLPPNSAQSVSKSLDNLSFDADNFLSIQREYLGSWIISHTLDTTDVIVSVYNSDFEKQVPTEITVFNKDTIIVDWFIPAVGVVIISKAAVPFSTVFDPVSWRIRHGYNRNEILYQIRNENGIVYIPEEFNIGGTNTSYATNAWQPNSQIFLKSGLDLGDTCDNTGDGNDDITITNDIWIFNGSSPPNETLPSHVSIYSYTNPDTGVTNDWYAWVIDHPNIQNVFQVACYDDMNISVVPSNILLDELDPTGNPQLVVLWSLVSDGGDMDDHYGFAAIDNVGDLVSFWGVIPKDFDGNLLKLWWRITLETEADVYTFLPKNSLDEGILFAGNNKDVHYFDYSTPEEKPYIYGETDLMGEDKYWYYYTFTVRNEAVEQLGIEDYKITAIELYNDRVKRFNKQRVVYNRLSGIFKPKGVNFVCHFRIFKDLAGLGSVLLDHEGIELLDTVEEYLYG